MSQDRRHQLRDIMQMAWSWFRQVGGAFSDALRTAWRRHKLQTAAPVKIRHLRSPVVSTTSRTLAGKPYANTRDFRAGGQIAAFGR